MMIVGPTSRNTQAVPLNPRNVLRLLVGLSESTVTEGTSEIDGSDLLAGSGVPQWGHDTASMAILPSPVRQVVSRDSSIDSDYSKYN